MKALISSVFSTLFFLPGRTGAAPQFPPNWHIHSRKMGGGLWDSGGKLMPYVWECTDVQVSKRLPNFERSQQLPKEGILRCKMLRMEHQTSLPACKSCRELQGWRLVTFTNIGGRAVQGCFCYEISAAPVSNPHFLLLGTPVKTHLFTKLNFGSIITLFHRQET